jgi:hypothetical protein
MSLRGLSEALGLGPDPERALAPLRAFYRRLDDALSRASAGLELPCGAGCSDCCHEAVFVSAPEFLLVAEALWAWPSDARRSVVEAMGALARRFEDELELLELLEPGPERDEVAARVKFSCPLLDALGRCRVYAARELNARTFGQTYDGLRGTPYGCHRTHARLRVLGQPELPDARAWRRALVASVPGAGAVRVYPWWFARYEAYF